jgi:hypothetical protein
MALAKELMGVGFSAAQASNIGGQYAAVTAAGSSQATATAIGSSMNMIAGADGTKGVTLPAAEAGAEVWLFNNSASTCPVYPPVGAAISVAGTGVGTANTAFSQLTYKATIYKYFTTTQIVACTTA